MNPETFQAHSARLEAHIHSLSSSPPLVNILRETIELRKLDGKLIGPPTIFEDLIRDAYAHLYKALVPGLVAADAVEERRIRMSVDNMLMNPVPATVETPPPPDAGEDATKKSGAKYITAREIVRKAEAIANKPAPTVPAKVLKPLAPAPVGEQDAKPPENAPRLAVVIGADNLNDAGSSAPGSVHDSADDESELSDVEEEVAVQESRPIKEETPAQRPVFRKPLFPGLLGTADNPQEIDGDTNDEQAVEEGDDGDVKMDDYDNDVQIIEPVRESGTIDVVKVSGIHEGNW